jgi:putative ABC transport system substrate-binding protein
VPKVARVAAFSSLAAWRADAVVAISDPVFGDVAQMAKLSAAGRLPSTYARREFAEAGGLLAYGPSFVDNYRRAATYVDRIFKGARPADLPVEQPTKFELVINLKTAAALGITVPPSLLGRADQVIQ